MLEDGRQVSYNELAALADGCFAFRRSADERPLVAVACSNCLASVAGYLGALRSGCPVLLVDSKLPLDLQDAMYEHYGVSRVWLPEGEWRLLNQASPPVHEELALLLSTSGSTGSSKLVRLTLENLHENAHSIALYLGLDASERPVTALPIHYSYGLSVLNSHLLVGATVLLTDQPVTSRSFWDFFKRYQGTSIAGVPMTYSILKQMRFERMELPSLRTLTQAGGKLPVDLVHWYDGLSQAKGQRFFVMYGQTEATARISYVPSAMLRQKAGSIGIAIPGGSMALAGQDGNIIEAGGMTGELRYTGPNVMMGYAADRNDLSAPDMQQGVLMTGDLAWRDDDGYFFLSGRLKRFIKVFGNRIGLDDVERQLRESGYDAAVTGHDDLLVIALKGVIPDTEELTGLVSSRYHLHRSAVRIGVTESFPMSSSGKIMYDALLRSMIS
jgi:acyl-coenzyme A synthetase/AMP-(fatty) acid ligase